MKCYIEGVEYDIPDDVIVRLVPSWPVKAGGPPYIAEDVHPHVSVEVSDISRVKIDGVSSSDVQRAGERRSISLHDTPWDEAVHGPLPR